MFVMRDAASLKALRGLPIPLRYTTSLFPNRHATNIGLLEGPRLNIDGGAQRCYKDLHKAEIHELRHFGTRSGSGASFTSSWTLEELYTLPVTKSDAATHLLKQVHLQLEQNRDELSVYHSIEPSVLKLYSNTSHSLRAVLDSPTLLPRHNANDRRTVRTSVKDIMTRHSTAGSTIEWLFDYASERKSKGNPVDLSAILNRHFTITLLCDHYIGLTDPNVPRGAVKRSSSVLSLIEDIRHEALFATAVAFPDSFVNISIPMEDPAGLPTDFYLVPSAFRYVLMELIKNAVSASQEARVEAAVTGGELVVTVRDR